MSAPGLLSLGTAIKGAAYGLLDLSINPASNKFLISSFTNLWCFRGNGYGCLQQGGNFGSVYVTLQLHILLQLYAYIIMQLHIIHQRPRIMIVYHEI